MSPPLGQHCAYPGAPAEFLLGSNADSHKEVVRIARNNYRKQEEKRSGIGFWGTFTYALMRVRGE